ncbi:MAG: ISL3 family transposase [Selenomonadaceae bacterium]|nr:ISL3 family transposase [Selenomonadaceae bacterium]
MLDNDYIEKILGLKDITVTKVEDIGYDKHIHLTLNVKANCCPSCGNETTYIHDYREQVVKDIDIIGMHTYIHLRKRRYRCLNCNKRFQEKNIFLPKYKRTTNRLWFHTINLLRDVKSMKQVAKEVNLSPASIVRIFDKVNYVSPKLPRVLGIDEFRGNSGGEKFNCILTDPVKKEIIDILPKRRADALYDYFSKFNHKAHVEVVTMDMSSLFKSVVLNTFPNATIVADKYHVVRQVSWAFENVRKRVQSELLKENRIYMKGSRRLLLKRQRNLSDDEMLEVANLLRYSKELGAAYYLKERFY